MKRVLFIAVAGLFACAPQPGPVKITQFLPMDPTSCAALSSTGMSTTPSRLVQIGGELNVAPGNAAFFVVAELQVEGLSQPSLTVGGRTLENENRDTPTIEEISLRYSSKAGAAGTRLGTIPEFTQPLTLQFDTDGLAQPVLNLISSDAALALDALADSDDPKAYTDLFVTIEFRGRMRSGARITSGSTVFPIRAIRRPPPTACTTALRQLHDGCIYPGQQSPTQLECCTSVGMGIEGC